MSDLEVIEDAGEVFRAWVASIPELVELVGDRVSITLTGNQPAIRYSVTSDIAGAYGEGQPLVLAQCWGAGSSDDDDGDDGTASLLARRLAAAVTGPHGLPAGVEQGPYQSNDPDTDRPRWLVGIRLLTFA